MRSLPTADLPELPNQSVLEEIVAATAHAAGRLNAGLASASIWATRPDHPELARRSARGLGEQSPCAPRAIARGATGRAPHQCTVRACSGRDRTRRSRSMPRRRQWLGVVVVALEGGEAAEQAVDGAEHVDAGADDRELAGVAAAAGGAARARARGRRR